MKKSISVLFASLILSTGVFAAQVNQTSIASILVNETTGEECLVKNESSNLSIDLRECDEGEIEEAKEIEKMPKNPQLAFVGQLVGLVIDYYALCSLVQFTPDLMEAGEKAFDDRTASEKLKDLINPDSTHNEFAKYTNKVRGITDSITATICLPVGVANKKLIELYND